MGKLLNGYTAKNGQRLVVGLGRKIEIEVNGERQRWQIVGALESDIEKGKISYYSPLIQCILGAKRSDKLDRKLVNRDVTIVIKRIYSS